VPASIPLTWLYVPGDRRDRINAALAGAADVVILDLEDAVTPDAKDAARQSVWAAAQTSGRPLQVRINAEDSPWQSDDADMLRSLPGSVGVRLPKIHSVDAVRRLADAVGERPLHLLIESALGVELGYHLARAHPRVATIALGEADLRADLGIADESGLAWARSRIVNAAAAAGLPPPPMSVYPNHRDLDGLAKSCQLGRGLGFRGRTAIHPAQLPVIRRSFSPTDDEVRRARTLLAAAERGRRSGHGAVALPDGTFVDAAVVRRARAVVDLADADGARPEL
jgi:citrate lyase subunit beta/citryl-CoA lyase